MHRITFSAYTHSLGVSCEECFERAVYRGEEHALGVAPVQTELLAGLAHGGSVDQRLATVTRTLGTSLV